MRGSGKVGYFHGTGGCGIKIGLRERIGQNATFVYNILMRTLGSWTGSFLSAVLSLPDPGMGEITDSADPLASLGVAVAACTITALILAPIDIVRTRCPLFLLTPFPLSYLC